MNKIRRKVLIVDDEEINRSILGNIIGQEHEVLFAKNGVEAMRLIHENESTLSLILLDLLMPEMDGYEVLKQIPTDPTLKRIPVIVLTSEKTAEVETLNLGAADFISKPYEHPDVILARVRRTIELAEDKIIIHETETDDLTGLYTKDYFLRYAERYDRYYPDKDMDAVVIDINRFHVVNELYGREYGNEVLRKMAAGIAGLMTENGGIACRSGSDTFYCYVPHRSDYETQVAAFSGIFATEPDIQRMNLRIGVYENVDKKMEMEQRFDHAASVCHKQRNVYSTSVVFYDASAHESELFSERLIGEMEKALREKQFRVFYQPKYNIKGNEPVLSSAEALIRWIHPDLGMISPGIFIPLFEGSGLVHKLDHYVWNEAASQIREWKENFGVTVPVSVNVSRVDIYDPDLEQMLDNIMEKYELSPNEYLLEITESAYTSDSSRIIDTVKQLRTKGFKIEMDDFGSGYSSLNMLASMPIDALKLDMQFIRNITENKKDFKMVELMLDIAKFLEVPVIAEGVETQEQYDLLKQAGCDIIQGYYFSKPVPPEEFARFFRK